VALPAALRAAQCLPCSNTDAKQSGKLSVDLLAFPDEVLDALDSLVVSIYISLRLVRGV
jgi:hypothetical protein